MKHIILSLAIALPCGAQAQNFTTAAEVRPILEATKASWIAIREYEGQDWLYFTQLLAWRCGISSVTYSTNGGPMQPVELAPCHEGTASPNALTSDDPFPNPRFELGSLNTVAIGLVLDDDTTMDAAYERPQVLIP